jgi:hypothetical protein
VYGDPKVCGPWFSRLRTPAETRDWLVYRELEGANDDLGFWIARLVNAVDRENVRSIGVMRRLGFRLGPNLHPDGADAVVGVLENRLAGVSPADI